MILLLQPAPLVPILLFSVFLKKVAIIDLPKIEEPLLCVFPDELLSVYDSCHREISILNKPLTHYGHQKKA
jgi:hypothetical protein